MQNLWENKIIKFIALANQFHVKMIMVGGGAVNFHGYQRHSANVDFWISTSDENLKNLIQVFRSMDYEIFTVFARNEAIFFLLRLPQKVKNFLRNDKK